MRMGSFRVRIYVVNSVCRDDEKLGDRGGRKKERWNKIEGGVKNEKVYYTLEWKLCFS